MEPTSWYYGAFMLGQERNWPGSSECQSDVERQELWHWNRGYIHGISMDAVWLLTLGLLCNASKYRMVLHAASKLSVTMPKRTSELTVQGNSTKTFSLGNQNVSKYEYIPSIRCSNCQSFSGSVVRVSDQQSKNPGGVQFLSSPVSSFSSTLPWQFCWKNLILL